MKKASVITSAIQSAYDAAIGVINAENTAAELARNLAGLLVAEYKLDKAENLKTAVPTALKNAQDRAVTEGLKADRDNRAWTNLWAHVSTFCIVLSRPTTPVEIAKKDKANTKVIKPASATMGSIKEAQQAAKAIREGEGMSGNNATGSNGAKPAPAPVEQAIVKAKVSFADITPKLEEMLADPKQRAILFGFIRSHGYTVTEAKESAKAPTKAEKAAAKRSADAAKDAAPKPASTAAILKAGMAKH